MNLLLFSVYLIAIALGIPRPDTTGRGLVNHNAVNQLGENSMTEQFEKLNSLVTRIERHQGALGLNDTQFVARYQRYLGSAKTWRDRLIGREFKDFGKTLPKWERKLESMVAELDGRSPVAEYFPELPFARRMTAIYEQLQGAARQESRPPNFYYVTTKSKRPYTQPQYRWGDYLVFGRETAGLPKALLDANPETAIT